MASALIIAAAHLPLPQCYWVFFCVLLLLLLVLLLLLLLLRCRHSLF
jgi:hypothetical protein